MPRERKGSSSDDSGGSSSGESSGSDSSTSQHSKQDSKRTPKKDTSASRTKGGDSLPGKSRRGEDEDGKELHKKGKAGTAELSSSDGEHIPRSGPRSTVVQKVSTETKDKGKKQDEGDKGSPEVDGGKDKREETGGSRSKKRSRSESPKHRDSGKRWKEDRSSGRSSDRREDRRQHRDDRDNDRGRRWRDGGRRRTNSRRRDEDRRGDGSRRDADRDRYDRKRDRDSDRKSDYRSEKRRDRNDREKDRGSRREENKENKKNENVTEAQKRKSGETEPEKEKVDSAPPEKKAKDIGDITTRTGGAYIPPAKLRMLQAQITDKSSVEYQRMAWEALKKSINGLVNKVNVSNIVDIVREMFQENIVRGRGLLSRSVIQAQAASPTFTHVYAALVAIINTKFPQIGELILRRLILQFKRGFRRNDKNLCLSSTRFIAHLVNQQVAHEVIALEILTLLLENTTEDSVEVAISFLKECGQKLTEVSPRGINAIFERLRTVLHEALLDRRVQYMVEVMFAIRKDAFKAHPAIISDLDLVEEDDQFTHLLQLDDVTTGQDQLNVFKADDDYLENEEKYKELKKEILDEGSSDEGGSGEESGSEDSSDDDDDDEKEEGKQEIIDQTETNMVALRRTIYLTIQSSLDFEECAHKLLKMELKPGQEVELCYMILDCNAQLRTYEKFFGLLAQRFCQLDKKYVEPFQTIFHEQFETIHRLDTNKLRNVAKFFAHLLHTDAISWGVMSCMKLTEEDTTSASRIFIKILFLELSEYLGLPKLNNRLRDPTMQEFFEGILPRSNPKDTRFAINFFTTIGLGGLTEDLREHLKGISKQLLQHKQQQEQQQKPPSSSSDSSESDSSDSDSSDSSESGSSDSSDSDSEDSDSSSDSDEDKKKKKKTGKTRGAPKDKSRSHGTRRTEHQNSQHDPHQVDSDRGGRHPKRDDGCSRIEDKLLKLSLPQGMSLVDPLAMSSPPPLPGRKNRDKSKKKKGRDNMHTGERRDQRRQRNAEQKRRISNNIDQGGDRDPAFFRAERDGRALPREDMGRARDDMVWGRDDLVRGRDRMGLDREDMGRGRPMTPPPVRRQDGYASVDGRVGRRDLSPARGMARWDSASDSYFQQRRDRMDLDMSPPARGGERHGRISPPLRRDRQDFDDFPPPRRHDRAELDEGTQRPYVDLDVDGRYDSLPRGQRRRDGLSPLPRMGRRDMQSPPRLMDSPPRSSGRMDIDRGREDFPRGRGDLDRNMDRGRGDLDRGRVGVDRVRGEVDRSVDRGRRDMERERAMDRAREDMDRNQERGDMDRAIERGRVDMDRAIDRGRGDMDRAIDRGRGDMDRGRGNVGKSLERGREDLDWNREFEPGVERGRNMDRSRMDMVRNGDRGRVDMDGGRGNVSRSVERGRGDVERSRDLDRGLDRRDVDRELDRGRGDRGRMDDIDKNRMVERDRDVNRGRDRSRGRVEPESPVRQSRKEVTRSPPLPKRRDMNHSAEGNHRQGRDQFRETDDRGTERSVSPPARKEKVRERNDDSVPMRRSVSHDKKERRKTSHKNKDEGRRDRSKEKRRR